MLNPYESEELRAVCGTTLRPGGLELTSAALKFHPFPAGSILLDLGCGRGGTLEFLSQRGFEAIGVEKSPLLAAEARQRGRVIEADIHDLPLYDHSVDGIFCECVLSLVADQGRVLSECARVLKPGGALIISDLIHSPKTEADAAVKTPVSGCLAGAKPLTEYIQLLNRAGFRAEQVSDHSRALTELAARLVWRYGSTEILRRLWSGDGNSCAGTGQSPSGQTEPPRTSGEIRPLGKPANCGRFQARDYGYALIISVKEENQ